jgi:hypothetical protein
MPCEEDYIKCDNKQLGMNQLLNLLLTEIAPGVPAVRTCGAGGGAALPLLIGNFVFVNPLGNDLTGVRQDFHLPFLTLNAAKNAALAGDTIYVYGGTYNEANQLHKEGVKWHFVGKPVLNLFAVNVWADTLTGTTAIEIAGDAIINHLSANGQLVRVEAGTESTVHVDFHEVTVQGNHAFLLLSGTGIINIATKLEVTLVNRCIGLGGTASYVFNIDDIFCNSFIGGVSNAINFRNQVPVYDGRCVFNCRTIRSDRANGATISMQYGPLTGKAIFNITDKIHFGQIGNPVHANSAIQMLAGDVEVNGDIDGGEGQAINMETKFFPKTFVHNGNAWNDGTNPVFDCGADTPDFWSCGVADVKLNGRYTSGHDKVIVHRGEPNNKISIDGEIISTNGGILAHGLYLAANAAKTILGTLKIVMNLAATTEYGIGAAAARDVKIIHNVASNANTDGNITNQITGTNYVFDLDVE